MKKIKSSLYRITGLGLFALCATTPVSANPVDKCVLDMIKNGADDITIGEIKQVCMDKPTVTSSSDSSPIDSRLDTDKRNTLAPFTLMAHKPNFFMATYDRSRENIQDYGGLGYEAKLDHAELQFQVSIKTPLAVNLFDQNVDIYAAYTNRSFWQAFNDEDQNSAFFRETNHEPEVWVQKRHDYKLPLGVRYKVSALGFVHQSNGRSGDHSINPGALSRSWNRIYGNFVFEKGKFVVVLKPWYRIKEDATEDDNRHITDYLGHGEIRLAYKFDKHTFAIMSRNNIESSFSKGAFEASWSFPLWNYPYVKGYIQYFNGYGESLADYDQHNNRIGLGISLSDWL